MLAVRLSDETERRLDALAARTGRTKTFYARAAIEAHLDDLEDFRARSQVCLQLDQRHLGLDDRLARVVEGVHDVDELRQLLADLVERVGVAAARDRRVKRRDR